MNPLLFFWGLDSYYVGPGCIKNWILFPYLWRDSSEKHISDYNYVYLSAFSEGSSPDWNLWLGMISAWGRSVVDLSEYFSLADGEGWLFAAEGGDLWLIEGNWTFCFDLVETVLFGEGPELFGMRLIEDGANYFFSAFLCEICFKQHACLLNVYYW